MKAHFIGIAGVGMSATAILLKESGWEVTGSDEGTYPPVSTYLRDLNIPWHDGYRAENIPPDTDLIVVGKNAKLDPKINLEVVAAIKTGLPIKSFPEVLGDLTKATNNIVIVGSYGKSTATALLAWCLEQNGKDPSYFIGAIPIGMSRTSHRGKSDVFILEGDEYPSSHTDTRSKFLHYHAHDVLLTSAMHDHVNVFPTLESYLAPFRTLISEIPKNGLLVAMGVDKNVRSLIPLTESKTITYSRESTTTDWYAKDIVYGEKTIFNLMRRGKLVLPLTTTLLGEHNVENIVGVAALILEKKLLTHEELAAGVETFKGVVRRLDRKDTHSTIPVYEGFGSSYEKAKAAIAAIKLHYPMRRLIIVFEPHTFTWRNRASLTNYDDVFLSAQKVFVLAPATQGSNTHDQLTHEEIVKEIRKSGVETAPIKSEEECLTSFKIESTKDDVILLLTSGDLAGLIDSIPRLVDSLFPI